jgi:pimeloyl-ACP methyl ester carboxylesterase
MPPTRFAAVQGVRIAFEVHDGGAPDGDWLLLVHGLGYARWGWEPVVDLLAARYRVVLFDNRGIGESDVPPGPYDAATMAGDALAVLDAAGGARAHVLGTSLGGMIAQELGLIAPERIDRLVLIASTPGGEAGYPLPAPTRELIGRMPDMEPAKALRAAIDNALSPRTRARRPEIAERILDHRLARPQDMAGWRAQVAAGTTYEGGRRLADIAAPCLVVHGDDDRVVDPRNAQVLTDLLPDARLLQMRDTGHLPYWEDPEACASAVIAFLDER